jgi:RNA polymerase sigma-70 factor (ECF subfamily)
MNLSKDEIGELWDQITPKLYGYLINVTKNRTLADDVLQTAWLRAIENLPKYENRGFSFSAWLFAIARNELRMHWRKDNREISYDNNLHDIFDKDTGLEDRILAEQIMKKLSKEEQELLRLRYLADLPFDEIARLLSASTVSIRVKTHRALSRARGIIKEQSYAQRY